ncbi:MAG: SpoIID/LytB domain-containing protein [Actinobacteria bacterium]|nr:SpoIID/LytB domain-containing protein [Actinomycetota bacterium]
MRSIGALAILATLCLLLAGVPAASAARVVTIRGGGWGHGMGMSQYGAYGRALAGRRAERIVEHYYSGASVRRVHMPKVRVGLLQGRSSVTFGSRRRAGKGGHIVLKVSGASRRVAAGGPRDSFRVAPMPGGKMRVYKNGNRVGRHGRRVFGSHSRPLIVKFERFGSLARVTGKPYSFADGRLQLGTYASSTCGGRCLRLVLSIPMQGYLLGLGEVPSSWPQAALRAQAIAGRTYAFEKSRRTGAHQAPCDCTVYDSTVDQAYIADAKRTTSGPYWRDWRRAVKRTRRRVILDRGRPIQALYSSSSGGHTENNENVWGGTPISYLRGVRDRPDRVAANPNHTWTEKMSWTAFSSRLGAAYGIGRLRRVVLLKPFGVSGRVTVPKPNGRGGARIKGTSGTVRVSGYSLKLALGLRDTLFRISVHKGGSRSGSSPWSRQGSAGSVMGTSVDGAPEAMVAHQRKLLTQTAAP